MTAGAGNALPQPSVNYVPKTSESPTDGQCVSVPRSLALAHSLYNRALGEGSVSIHAYV